MNGEAPSPSPADKLRLIQQEFHSGPIPHPAVLQQYEQVLPGAAERILKMAEDQSKHRQGIESQVIGARTKDSSRGLLFGFLIGLGGITAGTIISLFSSHAVGGFISFTSLATLAGVFIYGSRQQRQQLAQRSAAEKS